MGKSENLRELDSKLIAFSHDEEQVTLAQGKIAYAHLKTLTAGEPTKIRILYHNAFEIEPIARYWFACNDFMRFVESSKVDHFWDRCALIPMNVPVYKAFPEYSEYDFRDIEFYKHFVERNRDFLYIFFFDGALKAILKHKKGFHYQPTDPKTPLIVKKALQEYANFLDNKIDDPKIVQLKEFLFSSLVKNFIEKNKNSFRLNSLYVLYQNWINKEQLVPLLNKKIFRVKNTILTKYLIIKFRDKNNNYYFSLKL